jgi:hypothetical protein
VGTLESRDKTTGVVGSNDGRQAIISRKIEDLTSERSGGWLGRNAVAYGQVQSSCRLGESLDQTGAEGGNHRRQDGGEPRGPDHRDG